MHCSTSCHFERSEKSVLSCEDSTVIPGESSLELMYEQNELEHLWETRVLDEASTFSFTLTDCGETVLELTSQGALDVSYTFEHTDWSHFSVHYDKEGQTGGTAYGFDPFGDNAVLRARCFLYRENGDLFVCQCCEITTQDDVMMNRSINTQEVQPDQNTFCLRFESIPLEDATQEDESQCWTYCSSDGRSLWQVELYGSFAEDGCIQADGRVTILDDAWVCEEAVFAPDGKYAVARVTLRRKTLGILVAEQRYEFYLTSSHSQ